MKSDANPLQKEIEEFNEAICILNLAKSVENV